jgi:hypothetical protein
VSEPVVLYVAGPPGFRALKYEATDEQVLAHPAVTELRRSAELLADGALLAVERAKREEATVARLRKALERIAELDGPGLDGSPCGACCDVARAALAVKP